MVVGHEGNEYTRVGRLQSQHRTEILSALPFDDHGESMSQVMKKVDSRTFVII
jgi:hypothetical protein